MCVCVCVCVCLRNSARKGTESGKKGLKEAGTFIKSVVSVVHVILIHTLPVRDFMSEAMYLV
jgi:hypothetical protein